jgi:putative endonuclease
MYMKGYVYILQDRLTGRFYIGSTTDINRRLRQHEHGSTKTTARMHSKKLVFSQEFSELRTARRIEVRLKQFKRRDFIEKIVREGIIKTQ